MFQSVEPAPPDPILGLTEAYKKDPNPEKINLGVGVYKDEAGRTPVLETVKDAERRILESETSKAYLPIAGNEDFARCVQWLLFDDGHPVIREGRAVTAHTPGGTAALRVLGDYLKRQHPGASVWMSEPTWANHAAVYRAAGVPTKSYRYFDESRNGLDLDGMLDSLRHAPAGDLVLLHGCCHNPSGVDPTAEQWGAIAELLAERQLIPVVDLAYQGFGDGLAEDAAGIHALAERCGELAVCSSFSKNFGLYNERAGALTIVAAEPGHAEAALSHVKRCARAGYSNPPAHGGNIVTTILGDAPLTRQWRDELKAMRDRINRMRHLFVDTLAGKGVPRDFSFIKEQRGMFSFSGLSEGQVERLRNEYSIYIVGSGRINVAGMSEDTMDRLCDAIAAVL